MAYTTRRWAKKISGKLHYFVLWEDWQSALASFEDQAGEVKARVRPAGAGGHGVAAHRISSVLDALMEYQDYNSSRKRLHGSYRSTVNAAGQQAVQAAYNLGDDDRHVSEPAPAQIATVCERIQATWTMKQRARQRVTDLEEQAVQRVSLGVATGYWITELVFGLSGSRQFRRSARSSVASRGRGSGLWDR